MNLIVDNIPQPKPMIRSLDIMQGEIKQRNLEANTHVIVFGLSADRPDGSSYTKAYFSLDLGVLSLWNGSEWLETTLT